MTHGLWWSFGEPRQENGNLVADFYYQIGKHTELRLPWPTQHFTGAGELPIHVSNGERDYRWGPDITSKTLETGRRLYEFLGKDAQTSLIRAFANPKSSSSDRILYLHFPTPQPDERELCLNLEDLPWELLHDGEEFISWRYSLQIIRTHSLDTFTTPSINIDVPSWGILLVTPFIFADSQRLSRLGLQALPHGIEEVKQLRAFENQTHGLVQAGPHHPKKFPGGLTAFSELESLLLSDYVKRYQIIHYVGHGVIFDGDPCLCFENPDGNIDYVSVTRLRKLFMMARDASPNRNMPSILFLNACSSSSRGRYSSGFASGLHDLGMCVLGYHDEIHDDNTPLLAASSFYKSLCVDQSLQTPQRPPNVQTAIATARHRLRDIGNRSKPVWGSLRAYLPAEISFTVRGRGFVERIMQKVYSHFAQWMNPGDYTDHLSIGFQFAILFGALMGVENLALIFPESILARHFTYQETVSEITRIFLIGPLSFLAAAIFIAWQTSLNYQFLMRQSVRPSVFRLLGHCLRSLPSVLLSGAAFGSLFVYSFARLDLMTAQTTAFASLTSISIELFWYSFIGILSGMVAISLMSANVFCLRRKETLHSYRTFYFVISVFAVIAVANVLLLGYGYQSNLIRALGWAVIVILTIVAYSLVTVKTLKEISWRALQKNAPASPLSWKKLLPLIGGALLVVFCYYLLEESVRFEPHNIQIAIQERFKPSESTRSIRRVEIILERALRQRGIDDVPGSLLQSTPTDWLLNVVMADYKLQQAIQTENAELKRSLLKECRHFLDESVANNHEVEFKDYFRNIRALVEIHQTDSLTNDSETKEHYNQAVDDAKYAVSKDYRNWAYLDTLVRAEIRLAKLDRDVSLLRQAAHDLREAEWNAFFLRSPKAQDIQRSIDRMAEDIHHEMTLFNQEPSIDYPRYPKRNMP